MHLAVAHEVVEVGLELGTVLAGLGEAGGEDDGEGGLALEHLFEGVDRLAGEDDGEVEIAGHVEHRRVAALTEHRLVARMHRVEGGAVRVGPTLDLAGHRRVRLARRLRRADDRDRSRMQESVEVDVSKREGAATHIDAWRSRQAGSDCRRSPSMTWQSGFLLLHDPL